MPRFLRVFVRVILVLLGLALLAVGGVAAWLYTHEDELVALAVGQANRYLKTPVQITSLEASLWADFPRVSLDIRNVYVQGALPESDTLLYAQKLALGFDAWRLWQGDYQLASVRAEGGLLRLERSKAGAWNYLIWQVPDSLSAQGEEKPLRFQLSRLKLLDMRLDYQDRASSQRYRWHLSSLSASLAAEGERYQIALKTQSQCQGLDWGAGVWWAGKKMDLESALTLDLGQQQLKYQPSQLSLDGVDFGTQGLIRWGNKPWLDLSVEGEKTTLAHLMALLPSRYTQTLRNWKSEGQVYFRTQVQGPPASAHITADFGAQAARLTHPDWKKSVEALRFTGKFDNQGGGVITLKDLHGEVAGRSLTASVEVRNLKDPWLGLELEGSTRLEDLAPLFPKEALKSWAGEAQVSLQFQGRLADAQTAGGLRNVFCSGELDLKGVSLQPKGWNLGLENLEGVLLFNNNELAFSDLQAGFGASDMALTGKVEQLLPFLLGYRSRFRVEARILSSYVDVDQIVEEIRLANQSRAEASKPLQPAAELDLSWQVAALRYKKLHPEAIRAHVSLRKSRLQLDELAMKLAGGQLAATVDMDFVSPENVPVGLDFQTKALPADSLFFLFDNFGQDFLTYQQLGGTLEAQVRTRFDLDQNLQVKMPSLQAEARLSIDRGALRGFAPLQEMGRFFDRRELDDLRFERLSNTLTLRQGQLNIPDMEIRSNVATFQIRGQHSLENRYEYFITVPWKNFRKPDSDSRFGEIAEGSGGQTLIPLILRGQGSQFELSYDKAFAKNRIKEGLKREKEEFLDLFRKKTPEERAAQREQQKEKERAEEKKRQAEPEFMELD